MEQLEALTLPQRILAVVASLIVVGGLFYYLLIGDIESQINAANGQATKQQAEAEKLAQYGDKSRLNALLDAENESIARIEQNRKMLPSAAELPGFIDSLKADADAVGLQIMRFEIDETEYEDFYARIPVQVRAIGTFPQMTAFYRTLSAPAKRVSNIRDIKVKRVKQTLTDLEAVLGETDIIRRLRSFRDRSDAATPELQRYIDVLEYEAINSESILAANFTIHAFSYTGKTAEESEAAHAARGGKGRR